MKKALVLVLGLFLIACGSDEKKKTEPVVKDDKKEEEVSKIDNSKYPEEENILSSLDYIFQNEFTFDEGVVIEEIGLHKIKDDTYKTVFVLGEGADFDKIENLKVGMMFYPSDPTQLETEKDKKNGYVKTAVGTKIKRMGDEYVFVNDEFKIVPKKHKSVRFYFYQEKVVGENLILNNVTLRQ